MMTDRTAEIKNYAGQRSFEPRVVKLFRHRSRRNPLHPSSVADLRPDAVIHRKIGLRNQTNRINNLTESIFITTTNKQSKSPDDPFSVSRSVQSDPSYAQSDPSTVKNINGKNYKFYVKEQGGDLKRDQAAKHEVIQTENGGDRRPIVRSFGQMSFMEELKKKRRRKAPIGGNGCQCSLAHVFFYVLGGIAIATGISALLIELLSSQKTTTAGLLSTTTIGTANNISSSITNSTTVSITALSSTASATTSTTTTLTTETTTITYIPTGIYALQIPTCATWNATGFTVAGNSDGSAGNDTASLSSPAAIFVDNNYSLFIADLDNNRVVRYDANATIGVIVAGNGTPGNSASQLNSPRGVAVDQMGAIIVADSLNYRIQRFPLGSTIGTTIVINSSSDILGQTRDVHIDVNNVIYVTDSVYSRVVKYYPNSGVGVILAGANGSGSNTDQFRLPFGTFIDGNQTLYVADCNNQRIQQWTSGATNGITVAGVTNSNGSALTNLNSPRGVVLDNNGYIYIADGGNNRVVRWTSNYAAGGTCIIGCAGGAGNGATQLRNPRDLKFDASGNLYVSDQNNNRVQKYMLVLPANCSASG